MDDSCIHISFRGRFGQSQLCDRFPFETDGNRLFQCSNVQGKGKWQSERRICVGRGSRRVVSGALCEQQLELVQVNRLDNLEGALVG